MLRRGVPVVLWLVLTGLLTGTGVHAQAGALEVRVTSSTGAPVHGAVVNLRAPPGTAVIGSAETDTAGTVRFDALRPGRYEVSAQRLGFLAGELSATVTAGRVERVELVLRDAVLDLPGVVVEAERRRARFEESVGTTRAELTRQDLKLLPAVGEADVLRAIEVLPGVVSTSDFSSSFNVRGGSADQNLILLDGLPIYNPFHLGGLFSVFNADMVARAALLSGGFPAEYGGRVSSVLTVETDAGDGGTDVQGGVSVLAARVAAGFDLPADALAAAGLHSGRVRLSARRSYFDQLFRPFFDFPYHLTDVQGFAEAWTDAGGRLTVTAYTGRDVLDLTGDESFPLRVRWHWGNDVIGGGWTQPLRGGGSFDMRVGHTRFATGIRFPEFADTEFDSRIGQSLLRAGVTGGRGAVTLAGGVAADRLHYDNVAQTGGTVFGGGNARGWLTGVYGQSLWRPGPWLVETGMRLDVWHPAAGPTAAVVQPRVALRRFLGRDHAVKLAVGRYAQFAHSLRDEELPLGIDIWVLSGERAPHVVSDQAQLGAEGYLGTAWFAGVETYVRRFRGVTTLNPADDPNDPTDDLLDGTGLSYGADLHVRRESGRIRPMLAVSWLRATREFDDVMAAAEPPARLRYAPVFDRRLDIDLVVQALLPRSIELGVRWNFGTGLPYTRPLGAHVYYDYSLSDGAWRWPGAVADTAGSAIVLGPRNAERYPAYHRLDLGVRRTFRQRWGTITPHVDVLNVYDRRNVLFYFYQYDRTPPTRSGISMFPLLPTAGVEVSF